MTVEPSQEAKEAIVAARDARAANEAVLPLARRLNRALREASAANHFIALIDRTLAEGAE